MSKRHTARTPGATLLAFLVSTACPAVAETASIPYAQLQTFRTTFNSIPPAQRDKLILNVQMLHKDAADHTRIHAWVEEAGHHTDIPITPDGTVTLPDRPDWLTRNAIVQTDQPRHTLNLSFGLLIRPPQEQTIPVVYLLAAAQQAQQAIKAAARQAAGMLAMFATPTVSGIDIKFAACCAGTATLHGASGDLVLHQDTSGAIAVKLQTAHDYETGTITLSAPPTTLDPSTD